MTKMKQFWLLTAVAVVASLALGYFLAISPQKGKVEELQLAATAQRKANNDLQGDIALLTKQQKALPAKQNRLAEIAVSIPKTPMLPTLTRSLTKIASSSGVALAKIEPKEPNFLETDKAAAPAAPAEDTEKGKAKGKETDTEKGTKAAGGGLTTSVPSTGKLALVEVAVEAYGTYGEIQEFLLNAEDLKREMMVTNIKIQLIDGEDAASLDRPGFVGDYKLVLTARVFMRKTADQRVITTPAEGSAAGTTNGAKSDG